MTLCNTPEQRDSSTEFRSPNLPHGVPPLRNLYLYLTASCNLRCKHCWIEPQFAGGKLVSGTAIDSGALREAVIEAKSIGLAGVKLTGGEPLLHPQFKEIVDMLTVEGLSVTVETNGTLITHKIARYLKEKTNVGLISISIDSPVPAEHDAFRGVRGAFSRALRGLDYLVEAGHTNCQVIMTVHRGNLHQVEDLTKIAVEHKAATVKVSPVNRAGRGIEMYERNEALDFKEHIALFKYVNDELRLRTSVPVFMTLPRALTPLNEAWRTGGGWDCGISNVLGVIGTGEIALCGIGQTVPELVYGRLGEDSVRDIWLSHPMILKLRRDLDDYRGYSGVCGACIHAKSCRTGCVAN
ncbi:MAG: radical SAM protein, partial [Halobacteriota archaeon]